MAPFNNRQIGYIQAIAGRQQHVTLMCGSSNSQLNSEGTVAAHDKPQSLFDLHVVGGVNGTDSSSGSISSQSKSLLLENWTLDHQELAFDSRAVHNNDKLEAADLTNLNYNLGLGTSTLLDVFNSPVTGAYTLDGSSISTTHDVTDHITGPDAIGELARNPDHIPSIERATPDGFLNSTDVKFRFTLPQDGGLAGSTNPMGQAHYEFRWIVWRSKKPTAPGKSGADSVADSNMDLVRDGCSFRNPGYDFFMGQTGRKRGLVGYTLHPKLDADKMKVTGTGGQSTEQYSGKYWGGSSFTDGSNTLAVPTNEAGFTVDDLMTMRINRDDYVVMKDVRFFLGKEHGKSHFEDTLHWDWNDPIDTVKSNVLTSPTLNNKNYRWHMTLLGTTGGKHAVKLNSAVRWTTKMESG